MPKRNIWPAVRKGLRLTSERDKVDLQAPKDFHHVITGYSPLSVRLIEIASRPVYHILLKPNLSPIGNY
jgi:hypothetical protein